MNKKNGWIAGILSLMVLTGAMIFDMTRINKQRLDLQERNERLRGDLTEYNQRVTLLEQKISLINGGLAGKGLFSSDGGLSGREAYEALLSGYVKQGDHLIELILPEKTKTMSSDGSISQYFKNPNDLWEKVFLIYLGAMALVFMLLLRGILMERGTIGSRIAKRE